MFQVSPIPFNALLYSQYRVKWSITRLHCSCETPSTASTMAAFRSSSLSFKNPHRWKSRGLKSGLLALHGSNVRRLIHLLLKWLVIHCKTCLATWGAAPSCWNHWHCSSLTLVIWRSFFSRIFRLSLVLNCVHLLNLSEIFFVWKYSSDFQKCSWILNAFFMKLQK